MKKLGLLALGLGVMTPALSHGFFDQLEAEQRKDFSLFNSGYEYTINAFQIRKLGFNSVSEAIRSAPGYILLNTHTISKPVMGGMSDFYPRKDVVVINGVEQTSASTGGAIWELIDSIPIEIIDTIKVRHTALDKAATLSSNTQSVIEITTKKPIANHNLVNAQLTNNDGARVVVSTSGLDQGGVGYSLSVLNERNNGYIEKDTPISRNSLNATATRPTNKGAMFFDFNLNSYALGELESSHPATSLNEEKYRQWVASGGWSGEALNGQLSLLASYRDTSYDNLNDRNVTVNLGFGDTNITLPYDKGYDSRRLSAQGEYVKELGATEFNVGLLLAENEEAAGFYSYPKGDTWRSNEVKMLVGIKRDLGDGILSAALKHTKLSRIDEGFSEWGVAYMTQIESGWKAGFNFGESKRAPSGWENDSMFHVDISDSGLPITQKAVLLNAQDGKTKPESVREISVVFASERASVEIYSESHRDLLVESGEAMSGTGDYLTYYPSLGLGNIMKVENKGELHVSGVRIGANYWMPAKTLINVAYQYASSSPISESYNNYDKSIPQHTFYAGVSKEVLGANFYSNLHYASDFEVWPNISGRDVVTASSRVDVGVSYCAKKKLCLDVFGKNVSANQSTTSEEYDVQAIYGIKVGYQW